MEKGSEKIDNIFKNFDDSKAVSEREFVSYTSSLFSSNISDKDRRELFAALKKELNEEENKKDIDKSNLLVYVSRIRGDKKEEINIVKETVEHTMTRSLKPSNTSKLTSKKTRVL